MPLEFNQREYMENVFSVMRESGVTVRDFCKKAKISAATLYRARDKECPMDLRTIRKLDLIVAKLLKSAL